MNDIPTPADSSPVMDDGLARIVFDHMPQAFDCTCGFYPIEGDPEPALAMHLAEKIVDAGYHLPGSDEGMLQVPRVAPIELNAAVMDRKRDLVEAIEDFNDEVRS